MILIISMLMMLLRLINRNYTYDDDRVADDRVDDDDVVDDQVDADVGNTYWR